MSPVDSGGPNVAAPTDVAADEHVAADINVTAPTDVDVDVEQTVRRDPPAVRRAVTFVTLLVPVIFVLSLPSIGDVSAVAAAFAVAGSACVAAVIWRRGMDDDVTMAALAVFMDAEGILAGLLIPSGLAYAVLLPSVGVAASAGMRSSRLWAVLAVAAPLAGAVGAVAAFSWGPRAAVLNLPKPAATVGILGAISAAALILLWRARRRHERAVEAAVEAARRSAEAAAELARTRELLAAILGAAPFAIVSADLEGVVRYFNPAAEQQLGLKASDALGRQVTDVADMSSEEYGLLYGRLTAGEIVRLDPVRRGKVDERSVVAPIRGPGGEVVGAVSITEDVTERIRLEAELRQAQKMETLGQLSGAIAHDFNNLLQAIRGYAELAMLSATADPELASNLGEIRKASDRAADLTHQLLAFSQPGIAGARVVDVNETIEQCTPMIRRLVGPAIELKTILDADAGRAFIDPSQLQQAILNLAVNARDAMPGGGSVTIETLCPEDEPGRVRLAVSDTGTGIPDDIRHRIFDPFFTTKESGKGTGLGLTIVHSIVVRAGGEVRVDPEPAQGTRFSMSLPAVQTPLPDRTEASKPDARGTETVLLVEDEDAIRRLAQRVLTRHGYKVLAASGADEARQIWLEHGSEVDLLLSDVTMPGLSGPALAAELPGNPRTLFISGHLPNDPSMVFHIEKAHFLQKPFTVSELLGAVRQTLDAG